MSGMMTPEDFQKQLRLQQQRDRMSAAAAPFVAAVQIALMVALGVWVYRSVMKGK